MEPRPSAFLPPIEMVPLIKMMTQNLIIQFLAFFGLNSKCLQQQLAELNIDD